MRVTILENHGNCLIQFSEGLIPQLRRFRILSVACLGGERAWAIAIRPFYANKSSEPNFPIFLRKNGPNSEERGIYTNPSKPLWPKFFPF